MRSHDKPEFAVAEEVGDDTSAAVGGTVIGDIDGLVWEDASGFDIISVTIGTGQVAVPVEHDEWRVAAVVELHFDEAQVNQAPLLGHLQYLAPMDAIEQVATHYSVNLGGPPPGPDPQPLPPWWLTGEGQ